MGVVAAFAVACTPHYRDVVAPFGAKKALELKIVDDGGTFDLYLKHAADERPVSGLKIIIGEDDDRIVVISDERGHIAFPISNKLLADNPPVDVIKPEGVKAVRFSFTIHNPCVPGEGLVTRFRKLKVEQVEKWPALGEKEDRVYIEPGVERETGEFMLDLLAKQRTALENITGLPPPSIAVALVAKNEQVIISGEDRDGRLIWTITPEDFDRDRTTIGTIAHEWTHAILKKNYGFEGDEKTRYIEDGFCELLAHLTYVHIRGPVGSPIMEGRIREIEVKKKSMPAVIDILSLSEEFDVSAFDNIVEAIFAMCEKQNFQIAIGYGLGLAFWLDRIGSQPDFHRRFLLKLRNTKKRDIETIMGIIDGITTRPGFDPRAIIVEDALSTLKRHQ
jgi:hypothetical protein